MKPVTYEEAEKKLCPFYSDANRETRCLTSRCMAWDEVEGELRREDHSGANKWCCDVQSKRHQRPRREGPGGCYGEWVFDARGICLRLNGKGGEE